MPTRIHETGITFPDSTTQTTSGGPVTTQYAIGSYIIGRPADTNTYNNSTIAGSSLYAVPSAAYWNYSEGSGYWHAPTGFGVGASGILINTGSWRCVSVAGGGTFNSGWSGGGMSGLWVRYA